MKFMSRQKYIIIAALMGCLTAAPVQAACYADYKAKKDQPLQLHYGVIELPDSACSSRQAASRAIAGRLSQQGWTLLNVLSIFDGSQLQGKKASAGRYFLRF